MARGMNKGTQDKLTRVRPPRVQMKTDVDDQNADQAKELPCHIAVIADLTGDPNEKAPIKEYKDRKFEAVDRENFNAVFARCKPRVTMSVPDMLSRDANGRPVQGQSLGVTIDFDKFEDFEPGSVAEKVPFLKELLEARKALAAAKDYITTNTRLEAEMTKAASLLDKLVAERTLTAAPVEPAPSPASLPMNDDTNSGPEKPPTPADQS